MINTSQINPDAFGYMPTFPAGDGLTSFISGYLGAKKAGADEAKPPVDAAGKPTGAPPPKPSFVNRFTKGVMNAPGVRAEGADPYARLKALDFQQRLAAGAVELQGHELTNKLKLQQYTDTLEDQRTFEAFQEQVKTDPNVLSTGELPAFKTPQYRMAASAQQLAHSRGLLMEKNKQVILGHQKGLAELAGVDPQSYATISAMPDVNGLPSPDAMNALSEAMAKNKIGDKAKDIMPDQFEMEIGGKQVFGIRNPQTGSFQLLDPDKLSQTDLLEYRQLLSDRSDAEKSMGQTPNTEKKKGWQNKINEINTKLKGVLNKGPAPGPHSGGTPINPKKPQIKNADGSVSTERTITIEADGKFNVIPTIIEGAQKTPAEAIAAWRAGTNKPVGVFGSQKEADDYATKRSGEIGKAISDPLGLFDASK